MGGPEVRVVGNGRVFGVEAEMWSVEQVKAFSHRPRDDFSGDSSPRKCFAKCEKATGAGDGGDDGIHIEWLHATKVDNFDFISVLLQDLCSANGFVNHCGVCDNGGVFAGASDASATERKGRGRLQLITF